MKSALAFIAWLGISLSAGIVGSQFLPGEWYASLAKPAWNPPSYVFAPVWTTLYIMMGVAAWLVWRRAGFRSAPVALGLFLAQLPVNALWSFLFFGIHRPLLALLDLILLWGLIVVVGLAFRRVSALAAGLLIPYLLWVSFAGILNFSLWRLNT